MKLAFCFLTYDDVEHREFWGPFFAMAPPDKFTITVHSKLGKSSWLPGAVMVPTIPTEWGTFSLMDAQQSLFRTAALDRDVKKFILLSGDSIPLYRFDALYRKLTADDKGFIRKVENEKSIKKNPNMAAWPREKKFNWSLSSQWVILNRRHVTLLENHYPMLRNVFGKMYIPDEHMYIIFFEGFGELPSFNIKAPIHVQWDKLARQMNPLLRFRLFRSKAPVAKPCPENHRHRPHTFHSEEMTPAKINEIYKSDAMFVRKLCRLAYFEANFLREDILRA
jgi:hypothetical protein